MSKEDAKFILKEAVLSYPHFDKPQEPQNVGDTPKHSGAFVFTEKQLPQVKAAALAAAVEKWGTTKGPQMVTIGGKGSTIRNDVAGKYPEGTYYISARNESQPGLVYRQPGPDGKPAKVETGDIKTVFFPGAVVNVDLTAFAYEKKTNKGVGFALNNVQKWADGERLDGRKAAQDAFDADMSEAPSELKGLVG